MNKHSLPVVMTQLPPCPNSRHYRPHSVVETVLCTKVDIRWQDEGVVQSASGLKQVTTEIQRIRQGARQVSLPLCLEVQPGRAAAGGSMDCVQGTVLRHLKNARHTVQSARYSFEAPQKCKAHGAIKRPREPSRSVGRPVGGLVSPSVS